HAEDDVLTASRELAAGAVADLLANLRQREPRRLRRRRRGRAGLDDHVLLRRRRRRHRRRRAGGGRAADLAALEPAGGLLELAGQLQQLVAAHALRASFRPRRGRARSRMRSATSSLVRSGSDSTPASSTSSTRLVSVPKPEPGSLTSLATSRSQPF